MPDNYSSVPGHSSNDQTLNTLSCQVVYKPLKEEDKVRPKLVRIKVGNVSGL